MKARSLLRVALPTLLMAQLGWMSSAWAQGGPPPAPPRETDESQLATIPRATDLLSGHPLLGVSGRLALPFGELDDSTNTTDVARPSLGFAADLGIGVSRHVVLGVWGDYASWRTGSRCETCGDSSLGLGAFARYHLVQGFRFDPWLQLGAGYRSFSVESQGTPFDYKGIEWFRLGLGGDYYFLSQLGIGPYAELALGSMTTRPSDRDRSVYGVFSAGLRFMFDVRGR